jgi:hypothetical protein
MPNRFKWGNLLTRRPIVAISAALLVLQLVVLGYLAAGAYGLVKRYGPDTVSFVSFYAAGELAVRGYAPLAYDEAILGETEEDLTHPGANLVLSSIRRSIFCCAHRWYCCRRWWPLPSSRPRRWCSSSQSCDESST